MPAASPNYVADGNINVSTFVKHTGTTVDFRVSAAGAGDRIAGVAQEGPKAAPIPGASATLAAAQGDHLRVYGIGEECLLSIGATVAAGDRLKSDASGLGTPTTAAGDEFGAIAMQNGVNGDKIRVLVQIGTE